MLAKEYCSPPEADPPLAEKFHLLSTLAAECRELHYCTSRRLLEPLRRIFSRFSTFREVSLIDSTRRSGVYSGRKITCLAAETKG